MVIFTASHAPLTGTTTHARSPCLTLGLTEGPEKSSNETGRGPNAEGASPLEAAGSLLPDALGLADALEAPLADALGAPLALAGDEGAPLPEPAAWGAPAPSLLPFTTPAACGADEAGAAGSSPPHAALAEATHANAATIEGRTSRAIPTATRFTAVSFPQLAPLRKIASRRRAAGPDVWALLLTLL